MIKPKVLFIHGFCENSEMWSDLIDRLSDSYHCETVDLPGFGQNNGLEPLHSIREMASWVKTNYIHEQLAVIGHSMGGYVGLSLLEQFPDHIGGLSLFHSNAHADSSEKQESRLKTVEFIKTHSKEPFLKLFVKDLLSADHEDNASWLAQLYEQVEQTSTEAITASLRAMMDRSDFREFIAELNIPIQYVIGTKDKMYEASTMLKQATLLKRGIVNLLDSGHLSSLENPEAAETAIREFLTEVYPTT